MDFDKHGVGNKRGGGIFFCGGWNFSKSVSVGFTFIKEMRVNNFGVLKQLFSQTQSLENLQGNIILAKYIVCFYTS